MTKVKLGGKAPVFVPKTWTKETKVKLGGKAPVFTSR